MSGSDDKSIVSEIETSGETLGDPGGNPGGNLGSAIEAGQKPMFFQHLKNTVKRLFFSNNESFKESLDELIEEHEAEGEKFEPEEKMMLHNVLTFGDLTVEDVMMPRADIVAISHDISLDELKNITLDKQHTRMPVFKESLDNIIGFVHIKDLIPYFAHDKDFNIKEINRRILFVPPSMQIIDLLARMRASRIHMAIVVDEYGGTAGLVTMEDLMEELVGEIRDEHDESEEEYMINNVGNLSFEVNSRMPIDLLEEKLGINISTDREREDFDTVGGLIFFYLGRVPKKGEEIKHDSGLDFKVIDSDTRKVKKVLIKRNR